MFFEYWCVILPCSSLSVCLRLCPLSNIYYSFQHNCETRLVLERLSISPFSLAGYLFNSAFSIWSYYANCRTIATYNNYFKRISLRIRPKAFFYLLYYAKYLFFPSFLTYSFFFFSSSMPPVPPPLISFTLFSYHTFIINHHNLFATCQHTLLKNH